MDLSSPSPQPDRHMIDLMDTKNKKGAMKGREEQQQEEDEMMDDSCIFCGAESKAGHVHLQLLHQVQVFKSNTNISKIWIHSLQFRDKPLMGGKVFS